MGKINQFLHLGEDILFEVIKDKSELSTLPLKLSPKMLPWCFLGFTIICVAYGIITSWVFFIFAGICFILALFLFYVINITVKAEKRKERTYIITSKRIIEKSHRVIRINFSIAPKDLVEVDDDIAAIDLFHLARFEVEKRRYLYHFYFYLMHDPSNKSWVRFRRLKKLEKEVVLETLTELMPFKVKSNVGVEIYTRK